MELVSIVGARRAYEFPLGTLRLGLMANTYAINHVRESLGFEYGSVVQPVETFGPVLSGAPPGLAFYYGVAPVPEGELTPIRFVHFEPGRVVIDIEGPSDRLHPTYEIVMGLVGGIVSVSGADPYIPEPPAIRDQSEVHFRGKFSPDALVSQSLASSLIRSDHFPGVARVVPSIEVRPFFGERPDAVSGQLTNFYSLNIREGTNPSDRLYQSIAPLDSGQHIRLLQQIENALVDG